MRHDHPDWPANPYPDNWHEVTRFAYRTALSLIRPLNTVPFRLGEDGDYILQHPFEADYQLDGGEWRRLTVPQGLITDLTSVPRVLRIFVGRVGPWLEAAIIHDYLYIAWQDVPSLGARPRDRLFADRMMLRAMEAADVAPWERWAIYRFVRTFGGEAYVKPNPDRYAELLDPGLGGALAFRLPARQPGTSSMPEPPHG